MLIRPHQKNRIQEVLKERLRYLQSENEKDTHFELRSEIADFQTILALMDKYAYDAWTLWDLYENASDIEFNFIDEDGRETMTLAYAVQMQADFTCQACKHYPVTLSKPYQPVPLHYESIIAKCSDTQCPQCHTLYSHLQLDGMDYAYKKQPTQCKQSQA